MYVKRHEQFEIGCGVILNKTYYYEFKACLRCCTNWDILLLYPNYDIAHLKHVFLCDIILFAIL